MNIIFYDFEVFKYDNLVVFIDYKTREKTVIVNDKKALFEFYCSHVEDIWTGYNSRNYDQFILKAILSGLDPYKVSTEIINENKKGNQVVRNSEEYPLYNFDISTGFHSLKQLEAFLGSKIKESSIPFDIDRKLTEEEIQETIEYCTHDVEQTIEVFDNRKEEFDSQYSLIKAFDLPMSMFTKTKAQLSAIVLGALRTERDDEFQLRFPDTLVLSDKYKPIYEWYTKPENMNYKKAQYLDIAGVPHVVAWGGLHGAIPNHTDEGIILCCDVASLYPALMIEYGYVSRNVTNPDKYREIRDTRLVLKAEKSPMQLPYKIVLNATYGAMKDEYNNLYDPLMANNVCIAGQLLLLDLIDKIEPYCKLIQSNTDGLFLKVNDMETVEKIKNIAKEWEIRTRLDLEWEIFDKIYQKDVNNYIIIKKDGSYKSKGAYLKKLTNIDYDLPIINKALINYFVSDKPIETTINECNQLREFQKVVKVSRLYKYAVLGDVKINERVVRVFASKDENVQPIFKVKDKEGILVPEKIGYTPEKCFVNNENIKTLLIPDELDKQYYIDMANKRLFDFFDTSKVKKPKVQSDIKFVNNEVRDAVSEVLKEKHNDFVDVVKSVLEKTNVNYRQLKILIILNYFKEYGKNKKLSQILDLYNELGTRKQIKFKDVEKMNIDERLLEKYSEDKTETQYRKLDMSGYIKEYSKRIEDKPLSIREQIKNELEFVGSIESLYSQAGDDFYIIVDYKVYTDKLKPYVILRQLNSGTEKKTKIIDTKIFTENPFKLYNVLKIIEFKQNKKKRQVDGKWTYTGEMEDVLYRYEVY